MNHLAAAKNVGLNVLQYPSGAWGFVGKVPVELAWTAKDGGAADPAEVKKAAQFGARFGDVKTRTWATKEAAVADAQALGYDVVNA